MTKKSNKFEDYFSHLKQISLLGRIYKKYISSLALKRSASKFGSIIVEVGSGIGSGILGAYPNEVYGLDVNSKAVEYCKSKGLDAHLINDDGIFPLDDEAFDACVLDNVLEHIIEPRLTLDECYRVTKKNGGLVVAVPGIKGYATDDDHKMYYDEATLKNLHPKWGMTYSYSTPFFFKSTWLSKNVRQYCLVAVYKKANVTHTSSN